ncbi:unnamed protein product [Schistosoma curassoni]|uniref:Uncharacterized protein n=1 Tax=Schistosoma curassoni TaxID=6186 RepID=A0A183JMG9_9TREM|nr:unnamed protein product [Schistosoma curassoni]
MIYRLHISSWCVGPIPTSCVLDVLSYTQRAIIISSSPTSTPSNSECNCFNG